MRFPEDWLDFKGQRIAVEKLDEISGSNDGVALYRATKGRRLFAVFSSSALSFEKAAEELERRHGEWRMPDAAEELQELMREGFTTVQLTPRSAMLIYVREFLGCEYLKKLIVDTLSALPPDEERAGKVQVCGWLGVWLARKLQRDAKRQGVTAQELLECLLSNALYAGNATLSRSLGHSRSRQLHKSATAAGTTPEKQLLLFIDEGIRRAKARRSIPRRAKSTGGETDSTVQLELATALVEFVEKLNTRPSVEALSHAQRTASALHRSLHAEETFKRISAA